MLFKQSIEGQLVYTTKKKNQHIKRGQNATQHKMHVALWGSEKK